ncbi:zf-HC2 domain-containing protein [Streptomyces sp. NBC_01294]|uniref:zf-HC2 domain-containing protein n=1 Tax=Streptomyces sp. NBC_01294 TaxID=2903815 RepID=UPI002DD9922B|nr:zf-HC2 domain-containing protein [Streptomyces sp. NBC_01294]WRZ57248.1 zf-HC2 domain-containing protein [Streptomyces sp. NBC_01294]
MTAASPSPAEQHLGDRLAALVDGELKHDARERVLAHLATCAKCKAEADAQRRLKTMFVESAPPPLSAGLLARLQGLPGGGLDGPSGPAGPPGTTRPDPFEAFAYGLPVAARPQQQGFRIHEVGRPRRRFAFVAAGAVSLAALALGGALPLEAGDPNVRGDSPAPATRTGPALPVSDAAVRDRMPTPAAVPTLLSTVATPLATPLPPLHPTPPSPARPVSLLR